MTQIREKRYIGNHGLSFASLERKAVEFEAREHGAPGITSGILNGKRNSMKTWSILAVEISMALSGLFMIILMAIVAT